MSHPLRYPLGAGLVIAASLLTAACTEHAAPTAPPSGAAASVSAARSATSSGAIVVRSTLPLGFIIEDENRGLTTIIGFSAAELRAFCAGGPQPEVVNALLVTRPTDAVKLLFKGADISVIVWPFVSQDVCGVLAVTPPLAEGTAVWVTTDNSFSGGGPGANSFGSHAQGTVTDLATGDALSYLSIVRGVVSPDGEVRFPVVAIKLR
jgi:hypothetical protein